MGTRLLVDINIVIYYLGNVLPAPSVVTLDAAFEAEAHLSIITRIELLGYQPADENEAIRAEAFVQRASIHQLTEAVVIETIALRKTYRIKLPDAIIAATALVHGFTLISRNDADFGKIAGLLYWNPSTSPTPPLAR